MNKGLTDKLKAAFPGIKPIQRPLVTDQEIKNPYWISGFTSGEGCFEVSVLNSKTSKIGSRVIVRFSLSQHSRDEQLVKSLAEYLDCGLVRPKTKGSTVELLVTKFSDIFDKIIPFFDKYPIQGEKALNFADFCKVAEIKKVKEHFTEDGLEQICILKAGMNRGRES